MRVVGLDLSLTAPGVATVEKGKFVCAKTVNGENWKSDGWGWSRKPRFDMDSSQEDLRLRVLQFNCMFHCEQADLIVIEGLGFAAKTGQAMTRAGLHFIMRFKLRHASKDIVIVPPAQLKKFVTGKGNAQKSIMLREVYKRWGVECDDDNQADAVGLAFIGAALVGDWKTETKAQAEVIEKLRKA